MERHPYGSGGAVSLLSGGSMGPSQPADMLVMDAQTMQLLTAVQQGEVGLSDIGSTTLHSLAEAEDVVNAGIQQLMAFKAQQQQFESNRRQLLQQLKALDQKAAALAGVGVSAQFEQTASLADTLSVFHLPSHDLCDQSLLTSVITGNHQTSPQSAVGQAVTEVEEIQGRHCTSFDMEYLQHSATNSGDLGSMNCMWEMQSLSNSDTLYFPCDKVSHACASGSLTSFSPSSTGPHKAFCLQGDLPTQLTATQTSNTLSAEISAALGLLPAQGLDSSALMTPEFMGLSGHVLDQGQSLQQQSCSVVNIAAPQALSLLPPASCVQASVLSSIPSGHVLIPQLPAAGLPPVLATGELPCRLRRHSFHTTSRPHHAYKRVSTAPVWPMPSRSHPLQQAVPAASPFATAAGHGQVKSMAFQHDELSTWAGEIGAGLQCTDPAPVSEARNQAQGSPIPAQQVVMRNSFGFIMHNSGELYPVNSTVHASATLDATMDAAASLLSCPARSSAPPPSLSAQASNRYNGHEAAPGNNRSFHKCGGPPTGQDRCAAPAASIPPRNRSVSQLCGRTSIGGLSNPVVGMCQAAAPASKKGTGVFLPHKLIIDVSNTKNGTGDALPATAKQ